MYNHIFSCILTFSFTFNITVIYRMVNTYSFLNCSESHSNNKKIPLDFNVNLIDLTSNQQVLGVLNNLLL